MKNIRNDALCIEACYSVQWEQCAGIVWHLGTNHRCEPVSRSRPEEAFATLNRCSCVITATLQVQDPPFDKLQ